MAKLPDTTSCAIALAFVVMNLEKLLRAFMDLLFALFWAFHKPDGTDRSHSRPPEGRCRGVMRIAGTRHPAKRSLRPLRSRAEEIVCEGGYEVSKRLSPQLPLCPYDSWVRLFLKKFF
jgi:hypothetical protein